MSKQKIIVFGRGQYYKFKAESLMDEYDVIGFLDNNPDATFTDDEKLITKKEVLPIYLPTEYQKYDSEAMIFVMASRKSFLEMTKQLIDIGVDKDRIRLGINLEPFFDNFEELLHKENGYIRLNEEDFSICLNSEELHFNDHNSYVENCRKIFVERNEFIKMLRNLPCIPISRAFGRETGEPIDRYYIEKFLDANKDTITGDVMEIADDTYTKRFGHDVTKSLVLHVNGWKNTYKGNLETGEGIVKEMADCLICTQTVQMIYDIKEALKNIYHLLKPNGVALITIHGISQISLGDYKAWGEFWRVTPKALIKMASEAGFIAENISVQSFGNVKTSMCFLYGMSQEMLDESDFEYDDEQYPLIVTATLIK